MEELSPFLAIELQGVLRSANSSAGVVNIQNDCVLLTVGKHSLQGQSVLCSKSIVILQRKGDGRSTEFNFKGQVSRRYKLTERPQVKA